MLGYATATERSAASATVRASVLVYVGVLAPLATAVLPRDVSVIWAWLATGAALIAVAMLLTARRARRLLDDSQPYVQMPPTVTLLQHVLTTAAAGCFAYGLSGSAGIYRLTIVCSLLFIAIVGNRAMFVVAGAWTMVVLAATTLTLGPSTHTGPAVLVAYAIGFLVTAALVRSVAHAAIHTIHQSDRFVEMAAIAGRAETTSAGLEAMIHPIAGYLQAERIVIHRADHRLLAESPVAVWPAGAPALSAAEQADVRIAAVDGRVIDRDGWICIPTEPDEGCRFIVFAQRQGRRSLLHALPGGSADRIRLPIEMLTTRLSLIHDLQGLTRTDALTGLPNRRALNDTVAHELAVAKRTSTPVSVAMIDLDHFKRYNDTFGHAAGDQLLRAFADMLRVRLRATDFVARYGGEEFVVVLPFTSPTDAQTLFGELHRRCRELRGHEQVSFSAGVAGWDGVESESELVERADAALYDAKSKGRARTCLAGAGSRPEPVAPAPVAPVASVRRRRSADLAAEVPADVPAAG